MEGKKEDTETIYIRIMKYKRYRGRGKYLVLERPTPLKYHSLRQPPHQTRQGKVWLLNLYCC